MERILVHRKTETGLPARRPHAVEVDAGGHDQHEHVRSARARAPAPLRPSSTASVAFALFANDNRLHQSTASRRASTGRCATETAHLVSPLRMRVRVIAHQLDQDPVGRLRMQKADLMSARARPRHLVDERHAGARRARAARSPRSSTPKAMWCSPERCPCGWRGTSRARHCRSRGAISSTVQPAVSGVRMNAASVFCVSTNSRGPAAGRAGRAIGRALVEVGDADGDVIDARDPQVRLLASLGRPQLGVLRCGSTV